MEHLLADYADDIKRVSKEVARQIMYRYGYEIVSADDIEQSVWEQFLKSGMTTESLDAMDSAEAYIRTTARYYGANNEARARRRVVTVETAPTGRAETLVEPDSVGTDAATDLWWLLNVAERSVQDILIAIEIEGQRRVAWLCYFEGLNAPQIANLTGSTPGAVRKALQRARRTVGPQKEIRLRAWREFAHPGARRPQTVEGRFGSPPGRPRHGSTSGRQSSSRGRQCRRKDTRPVIKGDLVFDSVPLDIPVRGSRMVSK